MKEYVEILVYGEAYYSGREYFERVMISREIYDNIKNSLSDELCLGELDGKHSQVYGEICVDYYKESDFKIEFQRSNDGDYLFLEVVNAMEDNGYKNVEELIWKIENEVRELQEYKEVTVIIRKDSEETFNGFVKTWCQ